MAAKSSVEMKLEGGPLDTLQVQCPTGWFFEREGQIAFVDQENPVEWHLYKPKDDDPVFKLFSMGTYVHGTVFTLVYLKTATKDEINIKGLTKDPEWPTN